MRHLLLTTAVVAAMTLPSLGGEIADQLPQHLYDGTLSSLGEQIGPACDAGDAEACFVLGLSDLVTAYQDTARALYRHGAMLPNSPALAMLLGTGLDAPAAPANRDPEALNYTQLVTILDDFTTTLGSARAHFEKAGNGASFVIPIEPLRVRIDLDGDGTAQEGETLAIVLSQLGDFAAIPSPDGSPPSAKAKSKNKTADATIGFDNADAIWLAGYSTIVATPVDFLLAHDFSAFFDAYLHRVFPKAGLPMENYSSGGTLFMDPDTDTFVADVIAAIHSADFPVIDRARLAGVRTQLLSITALSRRNWELILAETDDNRELVPSPAQTSLLPNAEVTSETVEAWLATLDTIDQILEGELLVPHWRFKQGVDLKLFLDTATETDLLMLLAGQGALPFLADGPIADAESFAQINRVMGDDWPLFALWFN